jgi:hypothetical protein
VTVRPGRRGGVGGGATHNHNDGVRHLLAEYDLGADKIYWHIKTTKNRTTFLAFCRYPRSLYPPAARIAIVMDNFSPHLSTKKDTRVGDWAAANNVELAYVPTNPSWLNRIEAQFQRCATSRSIASTTGGRPDPTAAGSARRGIVVRTLAALNTPKCGGPA